MITEQELHEAIAECQGVRNPNANTCLKLASYYTILDHMRGKDPVPEPAPVYSYSMADSVISYEGNSEFSALIRGRPQDEVLAVIDELMETLRVVNPRLYNSVIRKLEGG